MSLFPSSVLLALLATAALAPFNVSAMEERDPETSSAGRTSLSALSTDLRQRICDMKGQFFPWKSAKEIPEVLGLCEAMLQDSRLPVEHRLNAGLVLLSSTKQRAPLSVFADMAQDPLISANTRLRAMDAIVDKGTASQKEGVLDALMSIFRSSEVSAEHRLKASALHMQASGDKDIGFSAFMSVLQDPATPRALWLIKYMPVLPIVWVATPEQKAQLLAFLKSVVQDTSIPLKSRLELVPSMDQCVKSIPALDWAVQIQDSTLSLADRFYAGMAMLDNKTFLYNDHALPLFLAMLQDEGLSLEDRFCGATKAFEQLQTRKATPLLDIFLSMALNPELSMEHRLEAGEKIMRTRPRSNGQRIRLLCHRPWNENLRRDAIERTSPLLQEFLVGRADAIFRYMDDYRVAGLVARMAAQTPNRWEYSLAQGVPNYNAAPQGPAYEIHNYAEQVQAPLLRAIDEVLGGRAITPYLMAKEAVDIWITQNVVAEKSANARLAINRGFEVQDARNLLARVYTFVETQHPEQMDAYMAGFVGESVIAYARSQNPGSCVKGVEERIFIGLRGIAFEEMFQSPEAEATAKAFMRNCNFQDSKPWMVQKLKELGVTGETSPAEAAEKFKAYGIHQIQSLNLGAKQAEYLTQVEGMAQTIEESYDDHLRAAIL